MEIIEYDGICERIYVKTLPSQMKCYIIPKKAYVERQAMVVVNYGSVDTEFELDGKRIKQPEGIAHFLEHKLFEEKKKSIFDEFTKLGGSVNAFTNFTNTAYYFNCIDNFNDNLKLLLKFVQNPYFTDENVEKEKGIITQEIEMYNDNPFWNIYLNLMEAMYKVCPVNKNIAGSVESIKAITKDLLYESYNAFYKPENMILVCVGDFEPEEVFEKAAKWSQASEMGNIKRFYGDEPETINQEYIEKSMSLARPMFNMGFKDNDFKTEMPVKIASTKLILDILVGDSSDFFEKLYSDGKIDGPFALEYTSGLFYGTAIFSNSCDKHKDVTKRIMQELESISSKGIDEGRFEQIRKKHIGRFVRNFNNIDSIAAIQADFHFKGMNIFDILKAYEALNIEILQKRLNEFFRSDNCVVSVINPI